MKNQNKHPVFQDIFSKIDPDLENWITIKSTQGRKIVMFLDKLTGVPNDIIKLFGQN